MYIRFPLPLMRHRSSARPSVLVALPAIIALGMLLAGCVPAASGDLSYTHSELDYTVDLPEHWRGVYDVSESVTEDGIRIASFDYTGAEPEQFVFRIAAYPSDVWNVMMPLLNTEPFARTDDHVFAVIRALDNPYEGDAQATYGLMAQDTDAIIGSFMLAGSEPFGSAPTDAVVYFGNEQLNPDAECATVFPLSRDTSGHPDARFATLSALLRGPTEAEKAEGYSSFFSAETADALRSLGVRNGTVYVNLADLRQVIPNASTSCGSASLLSQIETTLMQFPGVERVIIAFDGDTQTFYDWIQVGCAPENDFCNNEPFANGQME